MTEYVISGPFGVGFVSDNKDRTFALPQAYVGLPYIPPPDVPEGWAYDLSDGGVVDGAVFTGGDSFAQTKSVTTHGDGKWYAEIELTAIDPNAGLFFGITTINETTTNVWYENSAGVVALPATTTTGSDPNFAFGDTISIAVDFDALKIWFRKNGGTWTPGTPPSGTPSVIQASDTFHIFAQINTNDVITLRTDTDAFIYSPPAGFDAWYDVGGGATNVTADATGQALTASVGTVTVRIPLSHTVTGQAVTTSVGSGTTVSTPINITLIENVGATALTVTSASFSASAGKIIFAHGISHSTGCAIPTISDSIGGTWTPFSAGLLLTSVASRLWYKVSTGASQTVTVVASGGPHTVLSLVSVGGIGTDFSNFEEATELAGDPSVTLSTMVATSGAIYFAAAHPGQSFTTATGYLELFDVAPATNTRSLCGYDLSTPATSIAVTSTNTDSILYGLELKAPSPDFGVDAQVTGNVATVAVGDVTVSVGTSVSTTLTGQALTTAVGDVTVSFAVGDVAVTGQEASVSVGTVTVVGKARADVTTNLLTTSVGTVTALIPASANVSGNSMSVSVGTVTVGAAASTTANVTTNLLTTAVGTIPNVTGKANASLAGSGQQLTTSVGTIPNVIGKSTATVTGQQIAVASGGAGGTIVPTYLSTNKADTWPATVINASVNIGSASADRQIIAVLFMYDPGCHPVSATFAGVSASIDVDQSNGAAGQHNVSILRALVPTGSGSQSMSITVEPYTGNHVVDWYSVTGAEATPVDADGVYYLEVGEPGGVPPLTVTVDGANGGLVIAGFNGININYSFTGFDFEHDDSQGIIRTTSGYDAAASGPISISDNTATGEVFVLAAASYEPLASGVIVREGMSVSVTGQQLTTACGSVNIEQEESVNVVGQQLTVAMGSVSISGSGVLPDPPPDREGMMLIMSRWMGN